MSSKVAKSTVHSALNRLMVLLMVANAAGMAILLRAENYLKEELVERVIPDPINLKTHDSS